ncbi:MAG: hypothetical protein ACR2PX_03710 [Endozoicomonas sp.]|uniref:hypothetical protein n=1 Tax=Endozoicomonas sp. TaxID=1892382 RepID=UPI003D9BE0EA
MLQINSDELDVAFKVLSVLSKKLRESYKEESDRLDTESMDYPTTLGKTYGLYTAISHLNQTRLGLYKDSAWLKKNDHAA